MNEDFIKLREKPLKNFTRNVQPIEFLRSDITESGIDARKRLNSWINEWSHDDLEEVLGRLTGSRVENWQGAKWELYVNALLKWQKCDVKRIKGQVGVSTPDFLVTFLGEEFFLECTTVQSSHLKRKHEIRFNEFLDYLDNHPHAKYGLGVTVKVEGNASIKSRLIADQVLIWLDNLNTPSGDYQRMEIVESDWVFEFLSVPRYDEKMHSVQMSTSSMVGTLKDDIKLRKTIKEKTAKYRSLELEKPLILFIEEGEGSLGNPLITRAAALLGDWQVHFDVVTARSFNGRKSNGAWTSKNGLINSTNSAVALSSYVSLWKSEIDTPQIWHHPSPKKIWSNPLQFPAYIPSGDVMNLTPGIAQWNGLVE